MDCHALSVAVDAVVGNDALLKVESLQLWMLGGDVHSDGVLALEGGPAPRALVPHPRPDVPVLHVHPEAAQGLEELAVRLAEESPCRLHRVGVDERVDVLEVYKFVTGDGRGHS